MINMSAQKPLFLDSFNLSVFSTLLVTTCLLRWLFTQDFYDGTTTIYNTKTISCTVRATYYAKTT